MFSLSCEEGMRISQTVISSCHAEKAPLKFSKNVLVFTEQGVAMLSCLTSLLPRLRTFALLHCFLMSDMSEDA